MRICRQIAQHRKTFGTSNAVAMIGRGKRRGAYSLDVPEYLPDFVPDFEKFGSLSYGRAARSVGDPKVAASQAEAVGSIHESTSTTIATCSTSV